MTHKAMFSNYDKCDYSYTKNKVPVMHNFKKHWRQEPPRKLYKRCDFTCLSTGVLRFHQNIENSGLEGPQELKCCLVLLQSFKKWPSVNTESESMVFLTRLMNMHCRSVKSASFHLLKKAFFQSICTENIIVLSPKWILSATYAIIPSQ